MRRIVWNGLGLVWFGGLFTLRCRQFTHCYRVSRCKTCLSLCRTKGSKSGPQTYSKRLGGIAIGAVTLAGLAKWLVMHGCVIIVLVLVVQHAYRGTLFLLLLTRLGLRLPLLRAVQHRGHGIWMVSVPQRRSGGRSCTSPAARLTSQEMPGPGTDWTVCLGGLVMGPSACGTRDCERLRLGLRLFRSDKIGCVTAKVFWRRFASCPTTTEVRKPEFRVPKSRY